MVVALYITSAHTRYADLEARIGAAAAHVARVFSSVRYKRAALSTMSAQQRCSERKAFCKLIKQLQAADDLENEQCRRSEWAKVAGELSSLYAEDVETDQLLHEFASILSQHRADKITRREIWAAGPFLDLPHHESTVEEINRMVDELGEFLQRHHLDSSNPPAIVTVAKSTGDEYLPPAQLDAVLCSVLRMLQHVYGDISTQFVEYEPVEGEDIAE